MKHRVHSRLIVLSALLLAASTAYAADTTILATPGQVPDEQPPRINPGDVPTSFFDVDSWQGPPAGLGNKTNWHARYLADGNYLSDLFPAEAATLTVNDIARISYWTKRPAGTPTSRDWWIQIYTRPTATGLPNCASWYKHRLISNYNDHTDIGNWTQYATDDASPMTWNENACFGGGEQTLGDMQANFNGELIEMFSVQTDSGWDGFDGYLDGLEIELTNGSVGRVNFEDNQPVPAGGFIGMALLAAALALILLWFVVRRRQPA